MEFWLPFRVPFVDGKRSSPRGSHGHQMGINMYRLVFIINALFVLSACEQSAPGNEADVVFVSGAVYRVTDSDPWATAVAVSGKKITYVGDDDGVKAFIGPNTKVVNLKGQMLMPGFQDAHVHPVDSGMTFNQCAVFDLPKLDDLLAAIKKCVDEQPDADWIVGAGWSVSTFAPSGVPDKALLDAIAPNTPITLLSNAAHSVWANSVAIKRAGITAQTKDPEGGRIDRDPTTGEPSGSFQESAMPLIQSFEPPNTLEQRVAGLAYAQKLFHSFGITGVHDAYVEVSRETAYTNMKAYTAFDDQGGLKMHVVAAMLYDPTLPLEPQIKLFKDLRQSAAREHVKATAIKLLVDGVTTSYTAAMLEPYSDRQAEKIKGEPLIAPADLENLVTELDALGFQMHFHSIGDAATRSSLNAVEAAQEANGVRDSRHHISHIMAWNPEDFDRVADLGVIANFQALWAYWDPHYDEITLTRLGEERVRYLYPINSLHKRGAELAFGSDWYVTSANPLLAIEVAVTRQAPEGKVYPPLLESERIDLATAIRAATLGSARGNFLDDKTGSIEVGKLADLIVLDHNLFSIAASDISRTHVIFTMFEGEPVFGSFDDLNSHE
jgi:predicted amidohydrolase YtcJ